MRNSPFVLLCAAAALAQTPQRREGDWVVTGHETLRGASLTLAGKLIVPSGASLTIENATLLFDRPAAGAPGIEVRAGGALAIVSSRIRPAASNVRFLFTVEAARFTLRSSRVEGVASTGSAIGGGIVLANAKDAVIEDNVFPPGEAAAVQLRGGGGALLAGNTFESPVALYDSHGNTIRGNRFLRAGVEAVASHRNRIVENEQLMVAPGAGGFLLWLGSAYNLVARNRARQDPAAASGCFAYRVVGAHLPNWIAGNDVEGFRYAVLVSYSANTIVAGNRIRQMTEQGIGNIEVYRSRAVQVLNNVIEDSRNGITLFASRECRLRGNRVAHTGYGAALLHGGGHTVAGNTFERNVDNLLLMDSTDNRIEGNDFLRRARQVYANTAAVFRGNYFDDAQAEWGMAPLEAGNEDPAPAPGMLSPAPAPVPEYAAGLPPPRPAQPTVAINREVVWENCERALGNGVQIARGGRLTIRNCTLTASPMWTLDNPQGSALRVEDGGALEILNSTVAGDGLESVAAIHQAPGGRLTIRDSRLRYLSAWAGGVDLNGDGAVIENNEITGGFDGVVVRGGGGHRIVNNRIAEVHGAIPFFVELSRDNVVSGNRISRCIQGISGGLTDSRVEGNRIEGALTTGIQLGMPGNLIRGNVLAGNTAGLSAGPSSTVSGNAFFHNGRLSFFEHPRMQAGVGGAASMEGNYWSDYAGADADGDGYGDEPYVISATSIDPRPRMWPPEETRCHYAVSQPEVWMDARGGKREVLVLGGGECQWSASSGAGWVRVPAAGIGPSPLEIEVYPNPGRAPRQTAIEAAGHAIRVIQAGAECSFEVSPKRLAFPAAGGAGEIEVITKPGCGWTVTPEAAWLRQPAGEAACAGGSGKLRIGAARNASARRVGIVRVAGAALEVEQAAFAPMADPGALVNGASGIVGPIAPGMMVSVLGVGIGPVQPEMAAAPQRGLGGARLYIGGEEAFLTYASYTRVDAIVPQGVKPGAPAEVRLERGGFEGARMTPVDAFSPAIFTLSSPGGGAAVVEHADSPAPARRGAVVTLFATGFGPVEPPLEDGQLPGPSNPPRPLTPFTILLAGQAVPDALVEGARVVRPGVLAVRFRVPPATVPGAVVPVLLRFACPGDRPCDSPAGVYMAVQ